MLVQVDKGQEAVHDVGGGVVQKAICFHAKFNGNTVRGSSDKLYHVAVGQVQDGQAGGHVQHGQAGVHDVCGGVV